jgi:tRNA A-37 threonylcarbamoyl transferase component Bud32
LERAKRLSDAWMTYLDGCGDEPPRLADFLPPPEDPTRPIAERVLGGVAQDFLGQPRRSPPGYQLLDLLGKGGVGVVYKARQDKLNRLVAFKMLREREFAGPAERDRFRTEAQVVAGLQHPHIIQIYEVGEYSGRLFFSMEFCASGSLRQRLARGVLAPRQVAELVRILAGAVHHAHENRVVHRDLKPANVLFDAADRPRVADFGLARKLDEPGLTGTGVVLGTPEYMAPEQAAGSKHTGSPADIYALGAILYECLTYRPPFVSAWAADTLRQVMTEEPVAPRRLNARVPRPLETICLKCLRKEPAHRYATAADLGDDLGRFLRGEPIRARPPSAWVRLVQWARRRPAAAALVVAGVLLALSLAAFSLRERELRAEADNARGDARAAEKRTREGRDAAELALAKNLARLLARPGRALSAAELEALDDLAGTESDRVPLLFLEEVLRRPQGARSLSDRADMVLRAAAGPGSRRRPELVDALLRQLRDPRTPPWEKLECIYLGIHLGRLSPEFAGEAARLLDAALEKEIGLETAQMLAAVAPSLTNGKESRCATAVRALADWGNQARVYKPTTSRELFLEQASNDALSRLDSRTSEAVAEALVERMGRPEPGAADRAGRLLEGVLGGLDRRQAARYALTGTCRLLDVERETISPLARHLDESGAVEVARKLLASGWTKRSPVISFNPLWKLAFTVKGRAAERLSRFLCEELKATRDPARGYFLAAGLLECLENGTNEQLSLAADALSSAAEATGDPHVAWCQGRVLAHLPASGRASDSRRVCDTLLRKMRGCGPRELAEWAVGLAGVLKHLPPEEAARLAGEAAALGCGDWDYPQTVLPFVEYLNEEQVATLGLKLARAFALSAGKKPTMLGESERGATLTGLAGRLDSTGARLVADVLMKSLEDGLGAKHTGAVARVLGAVLKRAETGLAVQYAGKAARRLTTQVEQAAKAAELADTTWDRRSELAEVAGGLSALFPHLNPRERAVHADALAVTLAGTLVKQSRLVVRDKDLHYVRLWGDCQEVFTVLAAYLDEERAARIARSLVDALPNANSASLAELTVALGVLLRRVAPQEARRLVAGASSALVESVRSSLSSGNPLRIPVAALRGSRAWLDAVAAAKMNRLLTEALPGAEDAEHLLVLSEGIAVTALGDETQLLAAARAYLRALARAGGTSTTDVWSELLSGLPPAQLNRLLEDPTCVGPARQEVLKVQAASRSAGSREGFGQAEPLSFGLPPGWYGFDF